MVKKVIPETTPARKQALPPASPAAIPVPAAPRFIDPAQLRRAKPRVEEDEIPGVPSVSAGPVDKVIEYAFNPTREKIREVTVIDRMQGRLFPQADMCNTLMHYCLEIAHYREDSEQYRIIFKHKKPIPPDGMDEFLFRTAQWQKSVMGKNLDRALDIALAETENKAEDGGEGIGGGADPWGKD